MMVHAHFLYFRIVLPMHWLLLELCAVCGLEHPNTVSRAPLSAFAFSLLLAGHLVFSISDSAVPPPNLQSHGWTGYRSTGVGRV
jgi:hypothetical protein